MDSSSYNLESLSLKNRLIKAATNEGMVRNGQPTEDLIRFHEETAKGGVAMTTLSYGAVSELGQTHQDQLRITEEHLPWLKEFVRRIHQYDCKVSIQLTHCGYFTNNKDIRPLKPLSPSRTFNAYGFLSGIGFSSEMRSGDLMKVKSEFGEAAELVQEAGFDCIELHMGHGYLLSQFLSPKTNSRKDKYGGSVTNRLRYPLEVLHEVKARSGLPVIIKMNLDDGFKGGTTLEDTIDMARILEKEGADALELSGGSTSRSPFYLLRGDVPLNEMAAAQHDWLQRITMSMFGKMIIKGYPFEENFFFSKALRVREAVAIPLVYLGGVISSKGVKEVLDAGFDLVAVGRALIYDPQFPRKISDPSHISGCNHCNQCIVEMEKDGVKCVIN